MSSFVYFCHILIQSRLETPDLVPIPYQMLYSHKLLFLTQIKTNKQKFYFKLRLYFSLKVSSDSTPAFQSSFQFWLFCIIISFNF